MTDRSLRCKAHQVRAMMDGRQTQLRMPLKPQPPENFSLLGIYGPGLTAVFTDGDPDNDVTAKLPYQPGDRLWVRETWKPHSIYSNTVPRDIPKSKVFYEAGGSYAPSNTPWRPSIHMPRWASRITLLVDDVKVQRLQEISEDDAMAEGCLGWYSPCHPDFGSTDGQLPREQFSDLWNTLYPEQSWDANPWVVALTFRVIKQNIDHERNAA